MKVNSNQTFEQISMLRPNQSLKLTEPAVDDFAARCWTIKEKQHLARVWSTLINQFSAVSLAPVR
jgi:hypothetical protein